MGALAVARLEIPPIEGSRLERTSGEGGAASAALERLAAFVPTEVLTLYVAVLAAADTSADLLRWVITGVCMLLAPLAVLIAHRERSNATNEALRKMNRPPLNPATPKWPMAASFVSFALWVLVLPGTVAASLDFYNSRLALVVLLFGEFGIGLLDRLLRSRSA